MGLVTGFLEIERKDRSYESVEQRLKNYREFVLPMPPAEVSRQGARCMDCGIPFCHNGCPVNNMIPDWNELVRRDPSQLHPAARPFSDYPGGHAEGFPDAFKQLDLAFYNFIASGCTGTPNFPTFADGDREVRICEAIAKSAREKTWASVGS